ncbi:hypothetical protein K435DRAFT_842917 [Dendrothele bispora CBS 962.96]|uniref:Uncharacterized protein n=1 Tax=Dendrothele bispora (strain CBS 962.96) TaxID=1314807 RepID=A0A4S8LBU9_DENBC|nr:hypothetical protein K435DRAFT_842917 [Dendrothele bispora CBS 962.96]
MTGVIEGSDDCRRGDFYGLTSSWSSSPPGAFQNSSDFGIYRSSLVACQNYHITTNNNNCNHSLGSGTARGASPEELLKQIQSERRMLELERRIMQLERDNLNKERFIFNLEQKLDRLQSRSPPEPEPPPDAHVHRRHNDYRDSPSSTPYKHHLPSDFYADRYNCRFHGGSSHSIPYTHHPPPDSYTNYDHGHPGSSSSRHPDTHHHLPVNHANPDHSHSVDSP